MKIGDKVRFLNDVGGGIVSGFPDKHTVLVCDEDGFEIPTLVKDVVVVETDSYNLVRKKAAPKDTQKEEAEKPAPTSVKQALAADVDEEEEECDLAEKELTFRPMAQERRGADELNLFLAFVPVDSKNTADTVFEAYMVNDCNYYIHFSLLTYEGKACHLRHEGELAPNTKLFLEEFKRDSLETWERISVQTTAYKRDKTFLQKPAMSVGLRIDGPKFYKLHAFQPSAFFRVPALVFEVIKNDKPVRSLFVDADELREAMQEPHERTAPQPARVDGAEKRAQQRQERNALIEVDLHANELLDTMVGLEPKDILDYQLKVFRETLDAHLREKGRRIVFIHGKGDGVLRKALLKELRARYAQCSHQDASFREYGYGATMVTI